MNRKTQLSFSLTVIFVLFISITAFAQQGDEYSTKTELYFGFSKNTGGYVTPEEWEAFEDSVIVKVFSSGFTTLVGRGRWLNENGDIIKEDSRVVIAVDKMTPDLNIMIDLIRDKYKRYFDQSAVLRIDYRADVNF